MDLKSKEYYDSFQKEKKRREKMSNYYEMFMS